MLRRPIVILSAGALAVGVLIAPGAAADSEGVAPETSPAAVVRADDPQVTFLVGLPRDREALDAAAVERSTPGNLLYRDHPSLVNAGKAYGAKSKAITRLRQTAATLGIAVSVDKGRILARLTAPVSTWEKVYGKAMAITPATRTNPFTTFAIMDGSTYAGAPAPLKAAVEEMVASYVEYDVSLDTPGASAESTRMLEETLADPGSPQAWPRNLGTLPAGTCSAPALAQKAVYAPGQVQQAYGTTALAGKGVRGVGARLTIVALGGGYVASDIAEAADCFGYTQPSIDVVTGTGVPKPFVNATIETHLDLITASSVLSRAESVTLLQVPDSFVSFTDAFARMLEGDAVPDVVSISYGICEGVVAEYPRMVQLNDDLLRMAAIVGTSVIVATGDNGTSMCGAEFAVETGEPTLWYPSTSPWVTAVGGTRLALKSDNTRRAERVWNDMPYVGSLVPAPAGSGGPSGLFARPWWQAGATPTGPRATPDLAVLGAIKPGWPVAYGGGIYSIGGTSGGAPFFAANLASMSARQRDRGFPSIGFANAWLYQAAGSSKPAFHDIETGNNGVQLVGCCAAYPGYDMASGLGAPIMDGLYATLPRPAG
jgi:subtilase family serine protease